MKQPKLDITDTRMLELIDILKDTGHIRYRQEFCDAIGMAKQNIRNVKVLGILHFSAEQIQRACKTYGVNANWIMGLDKDVFRRVKPEFKAIDNGKIKAGNKVSSLLPQTQAQTK